MVSNLDRYKKDLDRLIENGVQLFHSLQKQNHPEDYKKWTKAQLKKLPDFLRDYQTWYSESLNVVKQLIPEREDDFIEFYQRSKNRKIITYENYRIIDYLTGLEESFTNSKSLIELNFEKSIDYHGIVTFQFNQQLAILKSAKQRFESSLFDIKTVLQADLFDSELDASKELNKKGFVRGAGAIAGVVLEGHLKEVCNNHKIQVKKKNSTINDLNQLLKDNEVIDTAEWRKIQRLADLRNLCDHKRKPEPTEEKVSELIEGVEKTIKTLF